ncbi:pilus assembly protein TadG-related protein [Noviherbaspirillum sp. CPCC 100848]|uniref:Pilus assembly protein TadG-related protein n=1 Tax=Noviherbaspirillum album TaxID=3080276 RepID=A0ABU6JIJ1_9BURK|nr:pilus assembly protein TadG-related protein [Noviherbaspirillum sp. CPCC 100848]MEC4723328.1 pilus assembly protein TadG-related protein [Noviherbaspirillum sp. CPCC 100848]
MRPTTHRQQGVTIVTSAMVLLFLMGFMGIALDFGRLFIVKTELQTAMDSCALAAAQELNRAPDSLTRARSAGIAAGNLNRVDLQSADWRNRGQISDPDITFKNAGYDDTTTPADAVYVQCQHTHTGVQMWLLQAMGAFSGAPATYPNTQNVLALAVATRASAQTTCPIPVALKPKPGGTAPNYGFIRGDWVTLIMAQNASAGGEIGWANLDGSNNASQTEAELEGSCGTEVGDELGTPGVQTSVADVWNYRFGIYRNAGDPAVNRPDFTGYSYTLANWPSGRNAYDGPTPAGAHSTAANFVSKRQQYASCADTGTRVRGANSCETITGLSLNSFQRLAAPGNAAGGHRQYGSNRRIAVVPVINDSSQVIDYACMLMLQPLSIPMTDVQLEFLGNAGEANSPCTTNGLPGGSAGPLVPVLVQ